MGVVNDTSMSSGAGFSYGASVGNAISNFFGNILGIANDNINRLWNHQETTLAWKRALQQWERENEYNTPVEQMKRLREAGINPALAYSNGAFNQAASSPASPESAPSRSSATQAFQLDPTLSSQLNLMDAQAESMRADAEYKRSLSPYYAQLIETEKKKLEDFDSQIEKRKHEIDVLDEDKKLRIAQQGDIKFRQVLDGKKYMLDRKEIYARVKLYESEGKAYEAAASRDLAQAALTNQELKLFKDTYEYRVLGIKRGVEIQTAEFADLQAALHRAGIQVNWETGAISVDPDKSTGIQGSVWYSYANAIAGLIGEVFGMVVPIGKAGRAVKPLSRTRGYVAPGFGNR